MRAIAKMAAMRVFETYVNAESVDISPTKLEIISRTYQPAAMSSENGRQYVAASACTRAENRRERNAGSTPARGARKWRRSRGIIAELDIRVGA